MKNFKRELDDAIRPDFSEPRDFGLAIRNELKDLPFRFENVTIETLTKVSEEFVLAMPQYDYNGETFGVMLFFPKRIIAQLAKELSKKDKELSNCLKSAVKKSAKDGEEIGLPEESSLVLEVNGILDLEHESDYKKLGNDFRPFIVTEITNSSVI